MESTPVCGSCLHRQVCRYFYDEQILAAEQKYFPIQLGVISCPFHIHTTKPATCQAPVVQSTEHSFRPNLNKNTATAEPLTAEEIAESMQVTILKPCIVCAEKSDQLCEVCKAPICLNCVTEDMATGKSVCPTCWDAGPAAVIKESGELVHGS